MPVIFNKEIYRRNQEKFKARIGDRVKILFKARDWDGGWGADWAESMDRTVGQEGTIIVIDPYAGFGIRPDNETNCCHGRGYWLYPYYCVSLVR